MPPTHCHATFSCLRRDLLSLPAHILSTHLKRKLYPFFGNYLIYEADMETGPSSFGQTDKVQEIPD